MNARFLAVKRDMTAERTIDAEGRLAIAGFIDPHIHLDKAPLLNRFGQINLER